MNASIATVTLRDFVTLEVNTPPDKVLEAVRSGAHTRMPVYEGQFDNVVGLVNTKDLFYLFSLQGVVVLQDAMYPALFLRPDEPLGNALRLFRRSHRHMAVVRDEEGKVHGLLTLEDVESLSFDLKSAALAADARVRALSG